jgi:hypothetical protein
MRYQNDKGDSMKLIYVRGSAVKALAKANGKRVSQLFLTQLDIHITKKLGIAIKYHNAGKKTLDADCSVYANIV